MSPTAHLHLCFFAPILLCSPRTARKIIIVNWISIFQLLISIVRKIAKLHRKLEKDWKFPFRKANMVSYFSKCHYMGKRTFMFKIDTQWYLSKFYFPYVLTCRPLQNTLLKFPEENSFLLFCPNSLGRKKSLLGQQPWKDPDLGKRNWTMYSNV